MCPARRQGVCGETLLQVALVVLFVVLTVLAWSPRIDLFALGG